MNLRKIVTIMLFGVFTTALIPSHAMGRKYSEIQLTPDTFIISIRATDTTTQDKAMSGMLTRASEVTLRNGYKYFTITDKQDHPEIRRSSYKLTTVNHGQMTIKCYKKDPGSNNPIDAEFFLANKK